MKFNPLLEGITIYEAGKPIELVVREYGIAANDVVKLASNENPFGTSQAVVDAIKDVAHLMYRYPDDSSYELKEKLAHHYGVESRNIIIGSGSDQVIEFCVRAKVSKGDKVLMAGTTFAMYEIYSHHVGATVLRTTSREHNLDEFRAIYQENPDIAIIFLCLPNNPLGECLGRDKVYNFLAEISPETLVVVDGAYQEYAAYKDPSKKIEPADLIARFPNAIYLGTFSKAYGLGGMRVGYGIATREVIEPLYKLRPPFNITTLSLRAAIVALDDQEFVAMSVAHNFREMSRYEAFAHAHGWRTIESYTNFITMLIDGRSSKKLAEALMKRGVIVRDLTSYGLNALRITIGTSEQNDRFFEVMNELVK
ncbi:MAG: histidinol-phosphate transaminase [Campylobacterales bacterium]